ncbi:MAG: DUF6056 family protein [Lachnospiraceae bacterium]|nr:DUF6056 family protein [Lachnospiraceae bacterium]
MNMYKAAASASVVLLPLAALLLFFSNAHVPFMMDDLWYSTDLTTGLKLQGLSDVIHSQIWHYNYWGGRVFTHAFLQLSLMSGEVMADIINTLMTLVLVFEMYQLSKLLCGRMPGSGTSKKSILAHVPTYSLCFAMLISCCPNFMMSMLWQAGCANYVYSSVWILFFYICYVRALDAEKKDFPLVWLFIIPLGLITGWSTENMGPSSCVAALAVTVICARDRNTPLTKRVWMALGAAASFIGSVLCILAPGNFIRKSDSTEDLALTFPERMIQMLRGIGSYLFPALLLLAASYVLYRVYKNKVTPKLIVVLAGALLSYGAMIMSPHYPDRAAFGTCVLIECCACAMMMKVFNGKEGKGTGPLACILMASSVMVMFSIIIL